MTRVLVIGIGNPMRGDDGLGWHAVQQLLQTRQPSDVSIQTVQQLTMDLVEPTHESELVIFIDACQGEPAGILSCQSIQASSSLAEPLSHFFDPTTLLACVQALYGSHPKAILLSVSSTQFDYTETLSPPVSAVLPALLESVQALLAAEDIETR